MKPFCEIHVLGVTVIILFPGAFPRLVGLIFSCDEAPVVAADLFHIEEREKAKNVVVKNASEPFGVDDRSALLLQALDDTHVCIVITVEMIRDQIRIFKDDLFDAITVEACVEGRSLIGGPASATEKKAIEKASKWLAEIKIPQTYGEWFEF